MSDLNNILLILGEATLTLYPARADGTPMTDSPVWLGACAERVTVQRQWIKRTTTPTGARQPRNHPLVATYELTIERIWALPLSQLAGVQPDEREYVLDVVWVEEESREWHRRTFYGVTWSSDELGSREVDTGFTENQRFDAREMAASGGTGSVPVISESLPYHVLWLGSGGEQLPLYSYDADAQAFTALASTTGRATIGYDGSTFEIAFNGGAPVVESSASGLGAAGFFEQMPLLDELPRLDFYYASQRVASVSEAGLWARAFEDGVTPAAGVGKFVLKFGGTPVATLAAVGVEATQLNEV